MYRRERRNISLREALGNLRIGSDDYLPRASRALPVRRRGVLTDLDSVYYDKQEDVDKVQSLDDLIPLMQADREKNVKYSVGKICELDMFFEGAEISELKMIEFPAEYNYLLSMEKLDESTLKSHKDLWNLITKKPMTKNEIINREVALTCLNWAQSRLNQQVAVFTNSTLKKIGEKEVFNNIPNNKTSVKFNFSLSFEKGTRAKRPLKIGSYVVCKGSELDLDTPLITPAMRVVAIKDDYMELTVCIRNIEAPENKLNYSTLSNLYSEEVTVYEHQPDFIPQSMFRSIQSIKNGALDHMILPVAKFKVSEEEVQKSFIRLLPTLKNKFKLNEHQAKALYSICTSTHGSNPYVLHGPPGTGKTRLISKIVKCLFQMDPKVRILLTAPSNRAAEMIALKIMDEFDDETDNLLLDSLGLETKPADQVFNETKVLLLRSIGNDYFGRNRDLDSIVCLDHEMCTFDIPSLTSLKNYNVVISTLGCSSHIINQGVPPGFFTHIFLDEAGQASESDIWIPLGGLATRNTSVILCGDPKQLGPVYTLDLKPEVTKNFDSPLVRYMEMDVYKKDSRLFCQLERSYRCHQSILSIASELFYQSKLLTAIIRRHEPFVNWNALPTKNFPILFVNVEGSEFCERGGTSSANKEEIEVVMEYVQKIDKDFDMDPEKIGIISPYTHQTRLIRQRFKQLDDKRFKKLTIDSVERFQGSERDVIILSATRTNRLGFLNCDLRLNTLITRAKHLLIIIGSKTMLNKHGSWEKFIQYCASNNSSINWNGTVQTFNH